MPEEKDATSANKLPKSSTNISIVIFQIPIQARKLKKVEFFKIRMQGVEWATKCGVFTIVAMRLPSNLDLARQCQITVSQVRRRRQTLVTYYIRFQIGLATSE